jgi:hypothetical protein
MNAIQPVRPPLRSVEFRPKSSQNARSTQSPKRSSLQRTHRAIAIETTLKLSINLAISGIAISAMTQLIPYYQSGREKLAQLEAEVGRTETRVGQLRVQFNYYFDPRQAKTIMQQESNLTDPTQKRIVFVEPQEKSSEILKGLD